MLLGPIIPDLARIRLTFLVRCQEAPYRRPSGRTAAGPSVPKWAQWAPAAASITAVVARTQLRISTTGSSLTRHHQSSTKPHKSNPFLVIDVHAHDREVAKTALHRSPEQCPSNQTFECPLGVVWCRNRQGECNRCPSSSKVSLLNKSAQWHASATWNL